MTTMTAQATQVYRLYIRATPEAIWDAITRPELTRRYFYGRPVENTEEHHRWFGADGEALQDVPTLEYDPPRRLVHGWSSPYDEEMAAEPQSRVSWEIEPQDGGICKLTVVHDRLEGAPKTAASVSGGWMLVLSGLKTLLETGEQLVSA